MSLASNLNSLIIKYRFKPNIKLGQNFIISEEILEDLIKIAELNKKDTVLEIGSGTGFLTKKLSSNAKKVIAIEKDHGLTELLEEELTEKNIQLIEGDFLKLELPKANKIVALPPYFISKEIILKIIKTNFEKAVLVFQKEFCEKLAAYPGFMNYTAISVLTQYYYDVEIIKIIPAKNFNPKPGSDSAIILLTPNKKFGKAKNEKIFKKFIQQIFRYKNKSLKNAIKKALPFLKQNIKLDEKKIEEKLSKIKFSEKKVSFLEIDEFVKIFNQLI